MKQKTLYQEFMRALVILLLMVIAFHMKNTLAYVGVHNESVNGQFKALTERIDKLEQNLALADEIAELQSGIAEQATVAEALTAKTEELREVMDRAMFAYTPVTD